MHVEPYVELAQDMPRDRHTLCGITSQHMTWSGHTNAAHRVTCRECRWHVNAIKADALELTVCDKCGEELEKDRPTSLIERR
jgi:uncharacterized paraquat-inducible protein A